MAESYSASAPLNPGFRTGLSTRGQKLPALIQSRSTANLGELRTQLHQRRYSTTTKSRGEDDEGEDRERGSSEERERQLVGGATGPGAKRLMAAVEALKTPQMRSMRLIGNSNPRYQW